jgi:hypothetical protein
MADEEAQKKDAPEPEAEKKPEAAPTDAPAEASAKPGAADADADGEGEGDEQEEAVDAASPEAIAKRLEALGGDEDEADKIARAEEKKLLERKAKTKKGKKGGLEKAASKKLSEIGKRAEPKRVVATAVDLAPADPLMVRTQKLGKWAKENQRTVTIAGLLVAVGLLAVAGWQYTEHKKETEASVELAQAVNDEEGRIGDPAKDDDEHGPHSPRPVFKTSDERREAALSKYKEVESKFPQTGAAILARLSEGSLLLDKHDADGAAAAFNDVKTSPLAVADAEVRGRALEGLGFSYELKASQNAADANKNFDEAIKVYKEMENSVDVKGFKELAMYHQARCLQAKGDKDGAKAMLVTLRERLSKPGENHPFPYLEEVATDRLRALDPTAVPPKPSGQMGGMGGPGGGPQMNEAQIKALLERLKKQQGQHPGGGAGDPH